MNYIAIDPGVTAGCACAIFMASHLKLAGFARPGRVDLGAAPLDFVIVERPQADGRSLAARPKDLIDLAWAGAAVAYSFGVPVWEVDPRTWKGSIPKPVHHKRTWERLSLAEQNILPPGTETRIMAAVDKGARDSWSKPGAEYYPRSWTGHNILDAVALGVYAREHFDRRPF